jgi:hypothetical protein
MNSAKLRTPGKRVRQSGRFALRILRTSTGRFHFLEERLPSIPFVDEIMVCTDGNTGHRAPHFKLYVSNELAIRQRWESYTGSMVEKVGAIDNEFVDWVTGLQAQGNELAVPCPKDRAEIPHMSKSTNAVRLFEEMWEYLQLEFCRQAWPSVERRSPSDNIRTSINSRGAIVKLTEIVVQDLWV